MKSFRKTLEVDPQKKLRLAKIDPTFHGEFNNHEDAQETTTELLVKLRELQELLYATKTDSLLVVLQGLDAAGKDGVVKHVLTGLNPEGTKVAAFKQPSSDEAAHDFLWRAHLHTPGLGEIAIFNRSHYEDVLVVRVHKLAPKLIWKSRYQHIRNFEHLLAEQNRTAIVKIFLHISREEQLARFKVRLDEEDREWKISKSDYTERELWDSYTEAFEDALTKTHTDSAPWYVVPADHKWYRDLAVAGILVETLEAMKLSTPKPGVDIAQIQKDFEKALAEEPEAARKKVEALAAKKEKKLRKAKKAAGK